MAGTIIFSPSDEDDRIIRSALGRGEESADVIRRALQVLDQQRWLTQARMDMWSIAAEVAGNREIR
ncbi:hypothetical protein [Myceligenerans crystallogenes]|uniref:ParD-like antitoxin of type II toxin-antitoxin system n=1 Tax=Myceligenerans crystallogenes TaxID=316335 RepID=A0ABN2NFE4_9MICO